MSAVSTYAEALFEAARERDELEEVLSDLEEFVAALHESEELRLFYYGGQIPEIQKRRAIDGLTEGMKTQATNFLKVLVDNGREEILEDARKQADAQRERTKKEAREEGDKIIQRAREEIDRERESAVREVRREVADMVIQASEQVLGRSVDQDEHERLISQALDDLEAEVAGTKTGSGSGTA